MKTIRHFNIKIPIILTTAKILSDEETKEFEKNGITDYIPKPFGTNILRKRVDKALYNL